MNLLGLRPGVWPVTLRAGEVTVRPLSLRDEADFVRTRRRSAEWLAPWDATPPPGASRRPPSYRSLVRRLKSNARQDQGYAFAILVDGRFAGQVSVNNIVRGSGQFASIGYWIGMDQAGRGVMPRAVALVIDWALGPLGLHRIEVCIRPENTNSLRVVEKLGIPEVGYAPRFLHIDGAWRDHRIFAITAEDLTAPMITRLAGE